ncbi:hypothetical protein MSAN_00735400 [Mycena sanguinolenta]|uniref:Protein kinase domain-containing protein n=1 Tax=Mycena sanguinolenta TaxID=230812 RepID=A0A8H6Z568_9AGAR|nr:hypothetical protein MSAN_00735400 [Mycena sanguinolenta]
MDDHAHPDDEYDSVRFNESDSATCTGAFFPNSQHFVVEGGTFTSNTISSPPADYLRIPFGSIDLRNEIRLDEPAGITSRSHGRGAVRRLYSARVGCRSKRMTVALYSGDHAEEWRKSVIIHSSLRHPHILQIYATASASGIQAAVFHGDLIPLNQVLDSFRHSPILQAYIIAYTFQDELEAYQYCRSQVDVGWVTLWIRWSTGRLCAEVGGIELPLWRDIPREVRTLPPPDSIKTLHNPNQESRVIASLEFHQFYPLLGGLSRSVPIQRHIGASGAEAKLDNTLPLGVSI